MFEVLGLGAEFVFSAKGTEQIVQTVNELEKLSTKLDETGNHVKEFSGAVESFSTTMMASGIADFTKGMSELALIYGVGVRSAASWQDKMVEATRYMSDTSVEAMTKYNDSIAEMAKRLGQSKESINEAVVSYMQMGKTTDVALKLADNAGYASLAWGMSAGTISNSFRAIKSAFKVNMEDQSTYQKYLDMVNSVENQTAATASDIVSFVSDVGASMGTVGRSTIEQTMAMAAAARYANINIGEFGTTMQRLANTYANGKSSYFEDMGVQVTDAKGELIPFADALAEVSKKWDTYGASQKQAFVSGFGGLHAGNLSLYMGSYEEYAKALKLTEGEFSGSAEAEVNRVKNTFNFALNQMGVTFKDFGQNLWGTILPPLTKFVKAITKVADSFSTWMKAHPTIMKIVASLIVLHGVALMLSGVFKIVSIGMFGFISKIKNGITPLLGFTKSLTGLGIAYKGLLPTLKTSIVQLGKMSLTMGILYATWKYDLFGIRTMFTEFTTKMKFSMEEVKRLLSSELSVENLVNGLNKLNNSNSIIDRLTGRLVELSWVWKGVAEGWNNYELSDETFKKLSEIGVLELVTNLLLFKMHMDFFFKGLGEGFSDARTKINEFVYEFFGPAFTFLKDNVIIPLIEQFPRLNEGLESFLKLLAGEDPEKANQDFKNVGFSVGTLLAGFLALSSVLKVISVIGTAVSGLGKIFGFVMGPIKGVFSLLGKLGVGTAITGFLGNIGFAFQAVVGGAASVGEALGFLFPKLATFFGGIGGVFGALKTGIMFVLGIIGTVVTAILGAVGIVVTAPAWVVGAITVAVIAAIALVIKFRDQIWDGLKWVGSKIRDGVVFLKDFVIGKVNDIQEWFASLPGKMGYIVGYVFGTIVSFIINTRNNIVEFVASIPQKFEDLKASLKLKIEAIGLFFTKTLPDAFVEFGQSVSTFFTETIPQKFEDFITYIKETFIPNLMEWFDEIPEKIKDVGKNVVEGFLKGFQEKYDESKKKVKDFCDGVVTGFTDALKVESPSKVLTSIGRYTSTGFINGIQSLAGKAKQTAVGVANGVVDAFSQKANMTSNATINPIMGALNTSDYTSNLPITTDLNNSNTFYSELSESGVMGQIVTQLMLITQAVESVNHSVLLKSQFDSTNGGLSSNYAIRANGLISDARQAVTTNNSQKDISITIEKGAIENNIEVKTNSSKEEIAELLEDVLDDALMKVLLEKIREIKQVMNE